ncbi:MAG: prepilin-type N-terminal cleavage/methylation domain-containing protein [Polyangiaceae bacterium]
MNRRRSSVARRAERGFTLVELMVAMTAGLMISAAAMVLARNASRAFQQEARITSAQISAGLGMSRLAGDIQRAAFMSSPHVKRDPFVCGDYANWTAGMNSLAGVQITANGSSTDPASGNLTQSTGAPNNLSPDSIIIGGAFSTTEQFAVRNIARESGGTYSVRLQLDSGPTARALSAEIQGGEPICATATAPNVGIFRVGRFLRIVDSSGRHEYGLISACTVTRAGLDVNEVLITLAAMPAVPEKTPSNTCGWSGLATGLLVNPVSRVKYALRNLRGHARFGTLVAPPAGAVERSLSGDGDPTSASQPGRTELVRVELAADGTEIESSTETNANLATLEVVAEYAVDLKFGVISTAVNGINPTVTRRDIGDAAGYGEVANITNITARPNRVRAISVRFSTRARVPDRNQQIPAGPVGALGRFALTSVPGELNWARMRTLQAEVALPNQAGVTWD